MQNNYLPEKLYSIETTQKEIYIFYQIYHTGRVIYRDSHYPIINLQSAMENLPENVIHVTGFGVFRGFTETNPSWEAVSQLPNHIIHNDQAIPIVKHEVSVTYAEVDKKVQEIWSSKPKVSLNVLWSMIYCKSIAPNLNPNSTHGFN